MASDSQTFSISGPSLNASFNWNCLYDRAKLAACLVKGVYTLERDRQHNRQGSDSLANPWWESFGFTLDQLLIEPKDGSMCGAVFQNVYNNQNTTNSKVPDPRYVIAFRGTIQEPETMVCDVKLGIRCCLENLQNEARAKQAIQVVQEFVEKHGNAAVWIAGHSLGAALALLAGKNMAMSGSPVEAYIFNPPISLFPLEQLFETTVLKFGLRVTMDGVKALACFIQQNEGLEDHHPYRKLESWKPNLFVNKSDPVCSEYIGYFEHRVLMGELGLGGIERLASYSARNILAGGGESSSSFSSHKHLHYLPSAFVIVNETKSNFKKDHGISQWWNPKLRDVSYEVDI